MKARSDRPTCMAPLTWQKKSPLSSSFAHAGKRLTWSLLGCSPWGSRPLADTASTTPDGMIAVSHTPQLAVALFVLIAAAFAEHVTVLDPSNFDTVVNGDKHVLVKFFAPCM